MTSCGANVRLPEPIAFGVSVEANAQMSASHLEQHGKAVCRLYRSPFEVCQIDSDYQACRLLGLPAADPVVALSDGSRIRHKTHGSLGLRDRNARICAVRRSCNESLAAP